MSRIKPNSAFPRARAGALFLALLPASLGAAVAQDSATETDTSAEDVPVSVQKEEVVVQDSLPFAPTSNTITTKLPVEQKWTPANVGVVSAELIDEQNARVLTDALENVSGVNVQTGSGVFDFFVVRGFDSLSSGLVLTDGAPEPEVTFYQMYNTERVEVFKGPAGFLYGSNPLASAVNIVRKQPVPADFAVIGASAGSYETFEGNLDVNRGSPSGKTSFRLNGLWRESDGYRDDRESRALAINPAVTFRPSERSALNLNFEYLESEFHPDAGLPLIGGELAPVPRQRSYASPFDDSEQQIARLQIDYELTLSDRLKIRNKTYFRDLDWKTDGTLISGVFPNAGGGLDVARTLLSLDDAQSTIGNQFEALFSAETGRFQHQLLAGLEVGRFTDEYTLGVFFLPSIDLLDPVETATEPLFPLPPILSPAGLGDSQSDIVAPYLVDQIVLSERWQAMAGLRFDKIDFEDSVTGASRSDSEVSPMLGLVFAPTAELSLYANAGRSFSPPAPRASGESEPQESRQIEVGLRKEWLEGRVNGVFAAYELERENIGIPDDNGFTQQVGDQRSRGFEMELTADLGRQMRALLAYAYTDSELTRFSEAFFISLQPPTLVTVDRSGNASPFAPEHLAKLWLSRAFDGGWRVAAGARYVDDQFIAEDNQSSIDGYLLFDAAVSHTRGPWRFRLNLQNLTDEEYETRGFGSTSVIPGEPISAFMGFEYRL